MTREEVEEYLNKWRDVFERHRLKISRINKYRIRADHTHKAETDAKLPIVTSFKYIGSLSANEGVSQGDVNNYRIIIGWMKGKGLSWVMCDMEIPVELKDKVF